MSQRFNDNTNRDRYGRLPGDENLIVKFMHEAVEDEAKTAASGVVSYKDVEFVHIIIPGNKNLVIHDIANEQHKFRFIREYEAFKNGQHIDIEGTPLKMWPQISTAQCQTLASINVYSVEQLAEVADSFISRLNLSSLKYKAKAWLDSQAGQASVMKHQSELEARDREINAVKAELEQLKKAISTTPSKKNKTEE